jgi:hypothetical protein
MKAAGWTPTAFPLVLAVDKNPMRKIRLGSLIALGLLFLYAALAAGGLSLERVNAISSHRHLFLFLEICAGVLSFPLVMLVILLDPQYEVGLVMFILAAVANCYLWGYCIARLIRQVRRFQSQGTQADAAGRGP